MLEHLLFSLMHQLVNIWQHCSQTQPHVLCLLKEAGESNVVTIHILVKGVPQHMLASPRAHIPNWTLQNILVQD